MEKDQLRAFGLAVRQHRLRLNLSQDALADLAGLHRTYIGGIERGERNIGLLNVLALASTLGIRASDLLHTMESILKRE